MAYLTRIKQFMSLWQKYPNMQLSFRIFNLLLNPSWSPSLPPLKSILRDCKGKKKTKTKEEVKTEPSIHGEGKGSWWLSDGLLSNASPLKLHSLEWSPAPNDTNCSWSGYCADLKYQGNRTWWYKNQRKWGAIIHVSSFFTHKSLVHSENSWLGGLWCNATWHSEAADFTSTQQIKVLFWKSGWLQCLYWSV